MDLGFPMRGRGGRGLRGRGGRVMAMAMGGRGIPRIMPMLPMPMGAVGPIMMPGGMPMMPMMPAPMMGGPGQMMGMAMRGRGGGMMGMMRGRGGPGRFGGRGGGFMMGGPGAKLDPNGIREYYDLDNPMNNRAVLDYGDL